MNSEQKILIGLGVVSVGLMFFLSDAGKKVLSSVGFGGSAGGLGADVPAGSGFAVLSSVPTTNVPTTNVPTTNYVDVEDSFIERSAIASDKVASGKSASVKDIIVSAPFRSTVINKNPITQKTEIGIKPFGLTVSTPTWSSADLQKALKGGSPTTSTSPTIDNAIKKDTSKGIILSGSKLPDFKLNPQLSKGVKLG